MTAIGPDGVPVDFVVPVAIESEEVGYFAVPSGSREAAAIIADQNVRFARCNFRGRAAGSDQPGHAVRLADLETGPASRALRRRGSTRRRTYFRLEPVAEPTPWAFTLPSA